MRGEFERASSAQVKLTIHGYFPVHNYGCGICSLANLIYEEFGDFNTAAKIYLHARNHPLVGKDESTDILSFPILLEELSNNKYSGICYLNPNTNYNFGKFQLKGCSKKVLEKAIESSLKKELLIFKKDFCVSYPNILFLTNDNSGHALVQQSHSNYINNGYISHLISQGFEIDGIFKAFKK
jgi:hypothetical protein